MVSIVSENNVASVGCHEIANVGGLNLFMSFGAAWHGNGKTVDSLFSFADIKKLSPELLAEIAHNPVYTKINGEDVLVTGLNAVIMRYIDSATNEVREKFFEARSATDTRTIIQPADILEFLETTYSKFGAKFSSVGWLYGGEGFFVSAELPSEFNIAGDGHKVHFNWYDNYVGMSKGRGFLSTTRQVCANTCRAAWQNAIGDRFSFNHTKNAQQRVDQFVLGYEAILAAHPAAIELLRLSTERTIAPSVAINRVLDAVFGVTGLNIHVTLAETLNVTETANKRLFDLGKKTDFSPIEHAKMVGLIGKQINKRNEVFSAIMENYESETCKTARGSVYSAYQAITEYANYGIASKQTDRQQGNDFLSLATGKGGELTDAAWNSLIVAV